MQVDALALVVVTTLQKALAPVVEQMRLEEISRIELNGRVVGLDVQVKTLAERVADVEARAAIPGPSGERGERGIDGLSLDDIAVEYDGGRTLAFRFTRGDEIKTFPITLPIPRYQGVYNEGVGYVVGDTVTYQGSLWHCQTPTISRPGEHADAWRLMVKRGRDGKDARPTP